MHEYTTNGAFPRTLMCGALMTMVTESLSCDTVKAGVIMGRQVWNEKWTKGKTRAVVC